MTLASQLAKQNCDVTVFEASGQLGGLADAWTVGEVTWDRHYHVTLLSDFELRGLLTELGLETALNWKKTRTDFFTGKSFSPLNNGLDYLRFPPLSFLGKIRLAGTILYASRIEDGRSLEKITVESWLTKLSGRKTYEAIWRPLLRAKLGENYKKASAAFIWAIIRRLYAARRGGAKTELFGYIGGGYARVFNRFEAELTKLGVTLFKKTPVRSIRREQGRLTIETATETRAFDRVAVTVPAPAAARMCAGLTDGERKALDGIAYQGIVCASVLLTRPLRGAYLTYIADDSIPFTAVIEMSALVDPAQFNGHSLVYLPCYVDPADPLFEVPDGEIEQRFIAGLRRMYPDLASEDIVAFKVSRVRHVLAIPTLDYSAKLPPVKTSVPGLFVVNSAHIVNGTLNVNETVKLANDMMPLLLSKA